MIWTLKELQQDVNGCMANINNKWVPARPINWTCRSFKEKCKEAWMVFVGKGEVFTWPENQ